MAEEMKQSEEQWSGVERRAAEAGPAFPNDREPTEDELAVDIGKRTESKEDPLAGFFSNKGPLFAACWWLNYYASTGVEVKNEDLEDRVKDTMTYARRESDADTVRKAIVKARTWYANRQQLAAR